MSGKGSRLKTNNRKKSLKKKNIFTEMAEEKQFLLNQINFLQNYRNILSDFVINCKCNQNSLISIYNDLENKYLNIFQNIKIDKNNEINKQTVDGFEEIITNGSVLEIDCEDLVENEVTKQLSNDIHLEVIPKKEIIDDEMDYNPIDMNSNLNYNQRVVNVNKDNDSQEKCFDYMTSYINLPPKPSTDSLINSNINGNIAEPNSYSGKTIIVEKDNKIVGFRCNFDNCREFYKSINGFQSHIDRVHSKTGIRCSERLKKTWIKNPIQTARKSTATPPQEFADKAFRKKGSKTRRKSKTKQTQSLNMKMFNKQLKNQFNQSNVCVSQRFVCKYKNCTFSGNNNKSLVDHRLKVHKRILKTVRNRNELNSTVISETNGSEGAMDSTYPLISTIIQL